MKRSAARGSLGRPTLELNDGERALRRKTHETIRRVTLDLDPRVHLNTAVSGLMELVNELYAFCSRTSCLRIGREGEEACEVGTIERAGTIAVLKEADRGPGADGVAVCAAYGGGALGKTRA